MASGLPPPVPDDALEDINNNKIDDEKQEINDKDAKRQRNRVRAIDELIATEESYCNNLRILV